MSVANKTLSFRSTFRPEIKKSSFNKELAELLFIRNHFKYSSFPDVAFPLFITTPMPIAGTLPSF